MKVLSWNVWSENTSLSEAFMFVKRQNADVICLQEVSKQFLKKLQKLEGYTIVSAIDFYYVQSKRKKTPYFLVILSKIPIVQHQVFSIPTIQYDSILSQLFGLEECVEGQYIDLLYKGITVRLFNVHFQCYVRPKVRLAQLKGVLRYFSKHGNNVICGDFNTFGFWHFNVVVGWVYNYSWDEFFLSEKELVEEQLLKRGLVNIFNWETTYPWLGTQLDFIVTPKKLKVEKKKIFSQTYGSDHQPLLVSTSF